jgi:hypothetical protein
MLPDDSPLVRTYGREVAARNFRRGGSSSGPSTAAQLEARLAEVRNGPVTAESRRLVRRLTGELTEAQRRERESRVGTADFRPSEPLPSRIGSPYAPHHPMPATPGMRRRLITSTGEHVETGRE